MDNQFEMKFLQLLLQISLVHGFEELLTDSCITKFNKATFICYLRNVAIQKTISAKNLSKKISKLYGLKFDECNFEEIPLGIFKALPNLKKFSIENSNFSDLNEIFFKNGKELRFVSLSQNGIMEIKNNSFRDCKNLVELDLSENKISVLEADAFNGLIDLKKILLTSNNITKLSEMLFSSMQNLEIVGLSNNRIKEIPELFFSYLKHNISVDLSSNLLCYIQEGVFHAAQKIDLSNNGLVHLKISDNVKVLKINNNKLKTLTCNKTTNLVEISASNNLISTWECISEMSNLKILRLNNNPLAISFPGIFKKLKKLEKFEIMNTNMKLNEKYFCGLEQLTMLKVAQMDSYEYLKNAMPNLRQIKMPVEQWNCTQFKNIFCTLGKQNIDLFASEIYCGLGHESVFESNINLDILLHPPYERYIDLLPDVLATHFYLLEFFTNYNSNNFECPGN